MLLVVLAVLLDQLQVDVLVWNLFPLFLLHEIVDGVELLVADTLPAIDDQFVQDALVAVFLGQWFLLLDWGAYLLVVTLKLLFVDHRYPTQLTLWGSGGDPDLVLFVLLKLLLQVVIQLFLLEFLLLLQHSWQWTIVVRVPGSLGGRVYDSCRRWTLLLNLFLELLRLHDLGDLLRLHLYLLGFGL